MRCRVGSSPASLLRRTTVAKSLYGVSYRQPSNIRLTNAPKTVVLSRELRLSDPSHLNRHRKVLSARQAKVGKQHVGFIQQLRHVCIPKPAGPCGGLRLGAQPMAVGSRSAAGTGGAGGQWHGGGAAKAWLQKGWHAGARGAVHRGTQTVDEVMRRCDSLNEVF